MIAAAVWVSASRAKKRPCPDCFFCQYCSDTQLTAEWPAPRPAAKQATDDEGAADMNGSKEKAAYRQRTFFASRVLLTVAVASTLLGCCSSEKQDALFARIKNTLAVANGAVAGSAACAFLLSAWDDYDAIRRARPGWHRGDTTLATVARMITRSLLSTITGDRAFDSVRSLAPGTLDTLCLLLRKSHQHVPQSQPFDSFALMMIARERQTAAGDSGTFAVRHYAPALAGMIERCGDLGTEDLPAYQSFLDSAVTADIAEHDLRLHALSRTLQVLNNRPNYSSGSPFYDSTHIDSLLARAAAYRGERILPLMKYSSSVTSETQEHWGRLTQQIRTLAKRLHRR